MKRPSDQAKLLFFALLRGTATALATTGEKTAVSKLAVLPNIQLRLATRMDVAGLQRCNLECLPENYNQEFYYSHLRQWPGLALVAEHVPTADGMTQQQQQQLEQQQLRKKQQLQKQQQFVYYQQQQQQQQQQQRQQNQFVRTLRTRAFPSFPGVGGNQNSQQVQQPQPQIVAYVLGKIEQRPKYDYSRLQEAVQPANPNMETIGHVTSLAVSHDFRRQGLAQALMKQLHYHLEHYTATQQDTQMPGGLRKVPVTACGLHVRKSNLAACRLYENDGYEIENIIPQYYQDGEDAYFMRKRFQNNVVQPGMAIEPGIGSNMGSVGSMFGSAGTVGGARNRPTYEQKNCWKFGPQHLRLPRQHIITTPYEEQPQQQQLQPEMMSDSASISSPEASSESSSPELLTGTM